MLDVKTVTGVAYQGEFHAISTVEALDEFAFNAYRSGEPLLLEVELWTRSNPRDYKTSLVYADTAFFKLMPQRAYLQDSIQGLGQAPIHGISRPTFEFAQARR